MHTEHCTKIKITFRAIASYPSELTSPRKEKKKKSPLVFLWKSFHWFIDCGDAHCVKGKPPFCLYTEGPWCWRIQLPSDAQIKDTDCKVVVLSTYYAHLSAYSFLEVLLLSAISITSLAACLTTKGGSDPLLSPPEAADACKNNS